MVQQNNARNALAARIITRGMYGARSVAAYNERRMAKARDSSGEIKYGITWRSV